MEVLILANSIPKTLFLLVDAARTIRALGASLSVQWPLSMRRDLRQSEVAVHEFLLRLEDATREEDLDAESVTHSPPGFDELARCFEGLPQFGNASVGSSFLATAADIGCPDLAFAFPFDLVVGEEICAHVWHAQREIAHLR